MTYAQLMRARITAALIGLALTIPAAAHASGAAVPKLAIDNFGEVNATYFRGGQPQGRDYTDLAALGVKAVINLTSDDADVRERALVERAGMKYFPIPMTTHEPPTAARLAEFLKLVNDSGNQPVYVHCVGGRHRTGVMTAVYRMSHDGWTADRAFSEMKQYKFGMDWLHPEFKQFVFDYQPASKPPTTTIAATAIIGN